MLARTTRHLLGTVCRETRRRTLATSAAGPSIKIIEVSPRDGLQNEKGQLSTSTKVELIHRLQDAGAKCIESGAFVSPKWVPQVSAGPPERVALQTSLPDPLPSRWPTLRRY